jgi:uncharacterized protein YjbI with pentapeptide repeats
MTQGRMMDQTGTEWPTCEEDGCIGVRLDATAKCLAHADDEQQNATLQQLGETGEIDARGVPISWALLKQILAAAAHDEEASPTFMASDFERATFEDVARFGWATFQGLAEFGGATFKGDAWFDGATFQGPARFGGATFKGDAEFDRATFKRDARFDGATFQGTAEFDRATFKGAVGFGEATFKGAAGFGEATFHDTAGFYEATFQDTAGYYDATFQGLAEFSETTIRGLAGFDRATFQGDARFDGATFQGHARFGGATFQGHARFGGATFRRDAGFDRATFRRDAGFGVTTFEQELHLGPLLVYDVLRLDGAHFAQQIQIEASTRGLSCERARFPTGVQFRLRGAQIVLDDADLSGPSILAGIEALSDSRLAWREQRLVQAVRRLAPQAAVELSARPRLLSVQGANVAGLTVSNVDLEECRFAGAHNLDRLRLETKVTFSAAPVRLPWDWRQVIAEERAWRAARSARWATPQWWPAWLHRPYGTEWPGVLPAGQIAGLYRALRKGREDAKDEPGAADLYYGEMEMRRHAGRPTDNLNDEASRGQVERPSDSSTDHPTREVSRGQVERAILTVYWLVSGYGLRAWRALACLVAAVIGAAAGLRAVGFTQHRHPWSSAFLYTAGAVTHLVNPPEGLLTEPGQAIRIGIGLLGPVLLALALLALRGRVKR